MKTLLTILFALFLTTSITKAQDPSESGEFRSHATLCSGMDDFNLKERILLHADTDDGGMAVTYVQGDPSATVWEINQWRWFGPATVYMSVDETGYVDHIWLVFGAPAVQLWHYNEGNRGNFSCTPQGNTNTSTTPTSTSVLKKSQK